MKKNRTLFVGLTLSVLTILALAGCQPTPGQSGKYAAIAKCLTEKGVKFYGAYWCPHCNDQKKVFGDDMQYVTYVECDPKGANANPDACRAAGVQRYPTWGFPGQENVVGVKQPEELAVKANCEVTTAQEPSAQTQATAETQSTLQSTTETTETASTQATSTQQ